MKKPNLFLKYLYNLSETGYWYERALLPELHKFVAERNATDSCVLDFGCGPKPFAYVFEKFDGSYKGIDVYPGQRVDIVYDGATIPLPDASVDLVFASSVFEHVEQIENTLREIARVLRRGGRLAAVVPFMGHVHGTPYDFHRPTRYGWHSLCERAFGKQARIDVVPVDTRLCCLSGMITGQINVALLDIMRAANNRLRGPSMRASLTQGGASPESRQNAGMRLAYNLLKANPINFLIGSTAWLLSQARLPRGVEGEITSGYLIKVTSNG